MRWLLSACVFGLACGYPTEPVDIKVQGPCTIRVVNYYNSAGGLDSAVTVLDTLACPKR